MKKIYAGIGIDNITKEEYSILKKIACGWAKLGWTLSTTGTTQAERAFIEGAIDGGGRIIICLPWYPYRGDFIESIQSHLNIEIRILDPDTDIDAMECPDRYLPPFIISKLTHEDKLFYSTYYLVVKNAEFVLAWPSLKDERIPNVMSIADMMWIPVYNLTDKWKFRKIMKDLKRSKVI